MHIFISYARNDKDEPWFQALITQMKSLDIPYWMDSKDIQGGRNFSDEIKTAIKQASVYVLVLSPSFMASDYIKKKELPCIKEYKDQRMIYPILGIDCAYRTKYEWLAALQLGDVKPLQTLTTDLNTRLKEIATELSQYMQNANQPAALPDRTASNDCRQMLSRNLLPYMPDRSELIQEMRLALLNFKKNQAGKPLVWIIHGNDNQCHYDLMDCIEGCYWERFLYPTSKDKAGLLRYRFRNSLPYQYETNQWHDLVAMELKHKFDIQKEAPEDVFDAINRRCDKASPVMLYDVVDTDQWQKHGIQTVCQRFIDFWDQWPGMCCQNPLIVCLMVRYKSFPVSLWQRLFRSRKKDPNLEFKETILTLKNREGCCVFPELPDISKKDIEDWYHNYKNYIDTYCSGKNVSQCIEDIFGDANQKFPMQSLAREIEQKIFNMN
jgi:hypothetical protein